MGTKAKSRRRKQKRVAHSPRALITAVHVKLAIRGVAVAALLFAFGFATFTGVARLEAHVLDQLAQEASSRVTFVDLPESLTELALDDLEASIAELLERNWTDHDLCQEMAARIATVAWVHEVTHVRRVGDGRLQVSCRFRTPFATVQTGTQFLLIDRQGVRLPGDNHYDESRILIQGAAAPAPSPGTLWPGDDIATALDTITLLQNQPFRSQVTAVLVGNYGGRLNQRASHIRLATDRPGGRIWWGSAPGAEVEENTGRQKIAILQANYLKTGRIDAGQPLIDVSTFPDRFVIPG